MGQGGHCFSPMNALDDNNRPAWLDHGLRATNPVYVVEQFVEFLKPCYKDDLLRGSRAGQERMVNQVRAMAADGRPVPNFALERLIRIGSLPAGFALNEAEPRPGVLGLVVDLHSPEKLVLPLS